MQVEGTGCPEVHRGRDGWLFLVGGSNRVLEYFTAVDAFPDSTVQVWLALLRRRRERCASLGVDYLHLMAPDKLSVYFEEFGEPLPHRMRSPARALPVAAFAAGLSEVVIDVLPYFLRQKAHFKLFWKTDTHWTFLGCFCAYQILCSRLGQAANSEILRGLSGPANLVLDLGAKLDPPLREAFTMGRFLTNARRVTVNPLVAYKERSGRENDGGLHVGSNVVFRNRAPTATDKVVVLFGDSFSEYRPHLLTGMLAETFREVHFVWSTSLDWSYIERVKPDLLITEAAERFASQVPTDTFDLDRFVADRLAPLVAAGS